MTAQPTPTTAPRVATRSREGPGLGQLTLEILGGVGIAGFQGLLLTLAVHGSTERGASPLLPTLVGLTTVAQLVAYVHWLRLRRRRSRDEQDSTDLPRLDGRRPDVDRAWRLALRTVRDSLTFAERKLADEGRVPQLFARAVAQQRVRFWGATVARAFVCSTWLMMADSMSTPDALEILPAALLAVLRVVPVAFVVLPLAETAWGHALLRQNEAKLDLLRTLSEDED